MVEEEGGGVSPLSRKPQMNLGMERGRECHPPPGCKARVFITPPLAWGKGILNGDTHFSELAFHGCELLSIDSRLLDSLGFLLDNG
jgi:hypothetical protein